jgi:autotransporter-associated beta strand protein
MFMSWRNCIMGPVSGGADCKRQPGRNRRKLSKPRTRLRLEALEERSLLSAFTPLQIRHAYGFDRVGFEDATHALVAGDGRGQTIGIVDAYDDPNIANDLAVFDSQYGLPAPPSFVKVNQNGGNIYPSPNTGWATEISLDVEYAHAMAPGANILLVEANDNGTGNLDTAIQYAANHGATAVSMSFDRAEFPGETGLDSLFTHAGVTYLSSTGDGGAPGGWRAFSPNVVAVGGTSLFLDGSGNYSSESGWSGSGGGISQYESQPAYQNGVVTQSTTQRCIPDVAFDADPGTGVSTYNTYNAGGWGVWGGTSLACPLMAGLTAVVDQGNAYLFNGYPSYSGTDFLNALYHLPQCDLNDIVTGNNGYPAGPGYDLVTGRGTPIVDRFVSAMDGVPVYDPLDGSLLVTGGAHGSNDTITLSQSGSQLEVQISSSIPLPGSGIPANQTFFFNSGQYSSVTISTGDGTTTVNVQNSTSVTLNLADHGNTVVNVGTAHNTVNLWENSATATTTISGSSTMTVNIGRNGSVQNVAGFVTVVNPPSYNAIVVDDSADSGNRSVGLDTVLLGGGDYGRITGLAPGTIDFKYADTSSILIKTGTGTENVFVYATGVLGNGTGGTTLEGHSANTTVIVGIGSVQNVLGTLNIDNPPSYTTININDSTDSTPHSNITLSTVALWGEISGLAPANIYYKDADTRSLTIKTGTASGNIINVQATDGIATTNLVGNGPTTVNVGNAGSVQAIAGTLSIENPPNYTTLNINDSADPGSRSVTLRTLGTNPADSEHNNDPWGQISGLAPAVINYEYGDVSTLTITGGTGGDTFTVTNVPSIPGSVFLNGTGGTNTLQAPNQANAWTLTVAQGGTLDGNIYFNGMQNLVGGTGGDTFTLASPVPVSSNIVLNSAGTLTVAASAPAANVLLNQGFDTVGPLGSPVTYWAPSSGGQSAAANWWQFMPTANSFATTELLPSTDALPGGGGKMLHFVTNAGFNGSCADGVFESFPILLPQGSVGYMDINAPLGTLVEVGFGDYVTSAFDSGSTAFWGTGTWTRVPFQVNSLYGANEIGFEFFGPGSGGQIDVDNVFASTASSGSQFLTGAINNNGHLLTVAGAGKLTLEGVVSGSGGLNMQGSGTLTLEDSNSYTGNTTITSGTVVARRDAALGAAGTSTTVDAGATLALYVVGYTTSEHLYLNGSGVGGAGALENLSDTPNTFAGQITLQGSTLITTVGGTLGALTLNGDLDNQGNLLTVSGPGAVTLTSTAVLSGAGGLTLQGSGTLTLSANNSYSGTTTVNGGTLVVNGSQPGSPITINSGGTLAGVGSVGQLIVNNGGKVAPGPLGEGSAGTLTAASADFSGGGTLWMQVNLPGSTYDTFVVTGALNLGTNASHLVVDANGLSTPTTFPGILRYGSLSGTFSTWSAIHTNLTAEPLIYGLFSMEEDLG